MRREGTSTLWVPISQLSCEGTAPEGLVCTLLQHFPESSEKGLPIVTGGLQRRAYKMVTSLASLFDKPGQSDALLHSLSNWCKVRRPESCISHPAYCVLSFDMGSGFTFVSDYQSVLIKQEPALPQNEEAGGKTRQILACLGDVSVTQHCPVLKSFRHLQLMINCE